MVVASKTDHPFTFLHHLKVEKKIFFAIIARIFDDQKSEIFWDDFLFFAVCGVKTGQKLFLRRGEKSVS